MLTKFLIIKKCLKSEKYSEKLKKKLKNIKKTP